MRERPFETLSGPWTGWSIQEGFRLSERYSLTISKGRERGDRGRDYSAERTDADHRADAADESAIQIRGWGTDADGDFSVEGYFLPHDASVFLVRRYVRAPKNPGQVGYPFLYEGSWNGYVVYGTWRASTEPDNTGPFEMWPEGEEELDDFMFDDVFRQETLPALAGP